MALFEADHDTPQGRLAATVDRLRQLIDHGPDAVVAVDVHGRITEWNATAEGLLGWTRAEVLGRRFVDVVALSGAPSGYFGEAVAPPETAGPLDSTAAIETPHDTTLMHKDGSTVQVEMVSRRMDFDGPVSCAWIRDIGWRIEAMRLTSRDALTGLVTRAALIRELETLLTCRDEDAEAKALLLIDLDRFHRVNEHVGSQAGDEVLHEVACRIAAAFRRDDVVARLSGDQFGVLITERVSARELRRRTTRLADVLTRPILVAGQEITIDVSIGVSHLGPESVPGQYLRDIETIWQEAESALARSTRVPGTRVEIYDATLREGVTSQRTLATELRTALDRDQLVLHYQPVFDAMTRGILGAEALVRWNHPRRGLLGPDKFIPMAEEQGLMAGLARWTLRRALQQISAWRGFPGGGPCIAVNLSATQLTAPELVDWLVDSAHGYGVDLGAGRLRVEVTESVFIDQPEVAAAILARLRDLGVGVSLDDFGTGFSSLAYLKNLPVDELKIDRSFVSGLPDDRADRAIAGAAVQLAHALDLGVIAEGVETAAQLSAVVRLGCTAIQGFLLARPEPVDVFTARLTAAY